MGPLRNGLTLVPLLVPTKTLRVNLLFLPWSFDGSVRKLRLCFSFQIWREGYDPYPTDKLVHVWLGHVWSMSHCPTDTGSRTQNVRPTARKFKTEKDWCVVPRPLELRNLDKETSFFPPLLSWVENPTSLLMQRQKLECTTVELSFYLIVCLTS